ncbi:hypothetical protein MHH93_14030 [Priestia sp. FSL H7-0729]
MKIEKDIIDNLALISGVVAALSALFAFSQARSAKKSLKLQSKLYEARKPNFAISDVTNSFLYNENGAEKVYYFFQIALSNLSDNPNSISNIQFKIVNNIDDVGFVTSLSDNTVTHPELSRIKSPINIAPHSTISGWLIFEINKEVHNQLNIDSHFVVITDIHNFIVEKEEISVREEIVGYDI